MEAIGAFEAKTHFSQLLDRVRRGERITITKRGVPAAMLVPVDDPALSTSEAVARLRRIRKGFSAGARIRNLIEDGRKY